MRTLSTFLTWFYKIVFPAFWIGGFGYATLLMFQDHKAANTSGDTGNPALVFLIAWLAGTMFLYLWGGRLKTVALDGQDLVISNYIKSVRVPLRYIERVSGSRLIVPELAFITFKLPTEFGTRIQFMPHIRGTLGFTDNPIVAELNTLAQKAKGIDS